MNTDTLTPTGPDPRLTAQDVGLTSSFASSGSSPTPGDASLPVRVKRKPIPRKGHTKSRRGCLSCKKRKVKCTEQLPSCGHCDRLGLVCEYPALRYQRANERTIVTADQGPRNALRATAPSFSLDDMRFFSHFMLSAYPSLPLNGEQIWMDMAQMSHEHECLMHSMLALGASHLTMCTASNYSLPALSHRLKAIQGLNKRLSHPNLSRVDGDVAFATLMALVFQSAIMPEGMTDFFAMIRGCGLLFLHRVVDLDQSLFKSFQRETHFAAFLELTLDNPTSGSLTANPMTLLESVRSLGPFCKSIIELKFVAEMQKALHLCSHNALAAYAVVSDLYTQFGTMTEDEFAAFISPDNHVARILMGTFVLVDQCLAEAISTEAELAVNYRKHVTLIWIARVATALPSEWAPYFEWALRFATIHIYGTSPALPSHWPQNPLEASTRAISQRGPGAFAPPPIDAAGSGSTSMSGVSSAPDNSSPGSDEAPTFDFDVRMVQALATRGGVPEFHGTSTARPPLPRTRYATANE